MKYIMAHSDTVGLSPTHPSSSHHGQSICAVRYGNLCKGHKTKAFYRSLLFNATRLRRELSIILICNRKVVQNWTTWKKGKALPPEESKREGSKLGMLGRTWKKHDIFALISFISMGLYRDCDRKAWESHLCSHSPSTNRHFTPLSYRQELSGYRFVKIFLPIKKKPHLLWLTSK